MTITKYSLGDQTKYKLPSHKFCAKKPCFGVSIQTISRKQIKTFRRYQPIQVITLENY